MHVVPNGFQRGGGTPLVARVQEGVVGGVQKINPRSLKCDFLFSLSASEENGVLDAIGYVEVKPLELPANRVKNSFTTPCGEFYNGRSVQ